MLFQPEQKIWRSIILKTRIISAIIAITIAAVLLFLHDTVLFYLSISLISVLILNEIFAALKCLQYKITVAICYIFAIALPLFLYNNLLSYRYPFLVICIILIFASYVFQHQKFAFEKLCVMITSTVLISLSMNTLIYTMINNKEHGVFILIISLCGAWVADTGAYFTGTFIGKHKLCPNISPKKTVEGLIGGIITNVLFLVLFGYLYKVVCHYNGIAVEMNYLLLGILGIFCAFLGLLGDLSASLLKRQCHIKDYGNIMPGHGGVLDRFDSVLFVLPFMSVVTNYFNIIQ